ncbi:MAG: hypothetical protein ACYDHF_00945 [Candidatus Cryosericum sp.]
MDETEKERLAQALKGHFTGTGRSVPTLAPVHPAVSPDIAPFAIAACVATPHLRQHIDDALRDTDPGWDELAASSALIRHPALLILPTEEAVSAYRLAGVVVASADDLQARACLDEVIRHGWHRVWQTVNGGESISLERFRELHPGDGQQGLDVELVVLVWYAGVRGIPVTESPAREALTMSLVRELHRATVSAAATDKADRSRYDSVIRYASAWHRATYGDTGDHELATRLADAREVLKQVTHAPEETPPTQSDIWQSALLLAGANPGLDDGTAVSMLAGLHALRRGSAAKVPVQTTSVSMEEVRASDGKLHLVQSELAAEQREVHRLAGELARARDRLSARDAENSRLMGILAARAEPEPEVQYAVRTINERVLVAGGHETLSRNLQTWLPNSVCISTNGKEDLDRAVLAGVRLVVVLTSYISHSFSGKVIGEAHKRDLPVLLLDWRSAKHILQEIDRALSAQQDFSAKQ